MTFWYLLGYSLSKAIAKTFFNYRVIGAENLIEKGPCIIAANHCSYLDPPLVGIACKRAIHYLARKSLLDVPILGSILPDLNVIPVDQKNADRSALMGAIRVIRHGGAVLIFPEGTRSEDGSLQAARPGLGMIAAKTGAPIVPLCITGSYEGLPKGARWPKTGQISVLIGSPIFSQKDEQRNYLERSNAALEAIARLATQTAFSRVATKN